MSNFQLRFVFYFTVFTIGIKLNPVASRAVNISNTWILPEEGFPVFYRYFKDRISWYEADAVCQFHHANLVTVDTTAQYDATRAYLKELDIVNNVWIGLIKSKPDGEFTWTERREYRPLTNNGYWDEQIAQSTTPLCVSTDPTADFRWHAHHCGGPEVASFICELPVPSWASQPNGCMLTSLPSLTVLYLPEQAAVELTSDCGLGGTKSIVCKGQADREEMIKQLSCSISPDDFDEQKTIGKIATMDSNPSTLSSNIETTLLHKEIEATKSWLWSSNTIDIEGYDAPTRHRRETDHTDLPVTVSTLVSSTSKNKISEHASKIATESNVEVHYGEQEKLDESFNSDKPIEISKIDTPTKVLNSNENLDDVEVFNPDIGPKGVNPTNIDKIINFVGTTEISANSPTVNNVLKTDDEITTHDESNSEPLLHYANSEPGYPSAINQGQLFGGENGTHFDLDIENDTAEITITLTTTPSDNNTKLIPKSDLLMSTTTTTDQSTLGNNEKQLSPLSTTNSIQLIETLKPKLNDDNIKLLELDTDFVATQKQEENSSKFIEIDDTFTMSKNDPNEHKVIEINIIDRKSKSSVPSKLIITTKVNNKPKEVIFPPLPMNAYQKFSSSVKKDGKNLKPPTYLTKTLPTANTNLEEQNTTEIIKNKQTKIEVEIPERIREQEIQTRQQQEANFRREFESITPPIINANTNSDETVDESDKLALNNDDLNSEMQSHKHRGGRLLTRSPHHNYYPYFFSRVLG